VKVIKYVLVTDARSSSSRSWTEKRRVVHDLLVSRAAGPRAEVHPVNRLGPGHAAPELIREEYVRMEGRVRITGGALIGLKNEKKKKCPYVVCNCSKKRCNAYAQTSL
jgi:hypothetical protein